MKRSYAILVLLAAIVMGSQLTSCTKCDDTAQKAAELATQNKAICQKSVDAMNNNNLALLDSIFVADYIEHTPDPSVQATGLAGLKESYQMMLTAYPDVKIEVLSTVAEGDKVVLHMRFAGTNTGPMGPMPATGKPVKADGVEIFVVKNGKITEHWAVYDSMTMMMQMGFEVVPAAADSAASDSAAH